MSALPDTTPSLVAAARRELLADSAFAALVSGGVIGGTTSDPWVWQWYKYQDVKGEGVAAVVVSEAAPWTSMNTYNTQFFPSLQVEIFGDVPRSNEAAPARRTAQDLVGDVFQVVHRVFHRPDPGNMEWGQSAGFGSRRVNRSVLNSGPTIDDVPDGDGEVRLLAAFAVSLG